jgi:hypothetical protein
MSNNHVKAAKNLRDAVLDNSRLSAADLRKRLADEGVDVEHFLKGADQAFRRGLQEGVRQQVAEEKACRAVRRGTLFGDLEGMGRQALLALHQAVAAGQFGTPLRARCRNKNPEAMSDAELRSWLEDIEGLREEN